MIVVQDVRGRYASEGEFIPFLFERCDSVDTIAWAASQPWSNGQVGMFGVSFQALTQWQAASAQPAALRAIAPSQSPHAGGLYLYQGGAFMLGTALTLVLGSFVPDQVKRRIENGQSTSTDMELLTQALGDFQARFAQLPLVEQSAIRDAAPYYFDWLAHPDLDEYWRTTLSEEPFERVSIPTLTISGWYDLFLRNDLRQHQAMKQHGGSELARQQQHLIIGPWAHGNFMWGYADRQYGEGGSAVSEQSVNMLTDIQLAGLIAGSRVSTMVWNGRSRCASLSWAMINGVKKMPGRYLIRTIVPITYKVQGTRTLPVVAAFFRRHRWRKGRRMCICMILIIRSQPEAERISHPSSKVIWDPMISVRSRRTEDVLCYTTDRLNIPLRS